MNEYQEKQLIADLLKIVHMGANDMATPEMAMAGVRSAMVLVDIGRKFGCTVSVAKLVQPID